jgi:hypothetical protein
MALTLGGLLPWIESRFLDENGEPLVGGQIFTYEAGTSTPQATYTDCDLTTPHANPIVLDAYGRTPGVVFLAANGYKIVVQDADDVELYTADDIEDVGQVFAATFGLIMSAGGKDVTSGYDVLTTDRLVTVDSTGGADPCLVNLPAAADMLSPVTIKNLGTVEIELTPNGADTIEGLSGAVALPVAVSPDFPTVTLVSDGISNWWITSSHAI